MILLKAVKLRPILTIWLMILLPLILVAMIKGDGPVSLLAQGFGLVSLSSLSVSLVLGCRSKWLDRFCGSLSLSYRLHHQIGLSVFIFLFLHVLMSAVPFSAVDATAVWDFLFDFHDPLIATGWGGIFLLLAGVLFSKRKSLERNLWRWLHRFLVLGLVISLAHFYFGFSKLNLGEALVLIYLVCSTLVLLCHLFFPQFIRNRFGYKITEVKSLSSDTSEITMEPESKALQFMPGQFIFLSVQSARVIGLTTEFHPYTLDSSPGERKIKVAVKALGDDSEKLTHIQSGNRVIVEGPYGNLLVNTDRNRPQLWIAGGIGVTPFISYIRWWKSSATEAHDVYLILLERTARENIFESEFSGLKGLKVKVHSDDQSGPPQLTQLLPADWKSREIAISGSSKMIKQFKRDLHRLGAHTIQTEEFDY